MVKYFDKNCVEISKGEWIKLKEDSSYGLVGEFVGVQFNLCVSWSGEIENADSLFRASYPLFTATLMQLDDDNNWITPTDSGKTFANFEKARDYYETFLMKYTESYVDEDGSLVEDGNLIIAVESDDKPLPVVDKPTGSYSEMVW